MFNIFVVLPGKRDELELDWAPKGNADIVDKYLKTLPSDQLPLKGSQAAKDRKQQLQKQIPIHDIDPSLCHELTENELNKMNEYIAHVKKSSVGVGQIVNLSSIIKGNLHMLNPNDAALIANRYPKAIPLSEVVKLHPKGKTDPLKHHELSQNMQNMAVKERNITTLSPNQLFSRNETMSPIVHSKIHDINYAGYINELKKLPNHPQYSHTLNKVPNSLNNPLGENILDVENISKPFMNQQNPLGFTDHKYTSAKSNNENDNNINSKPNDRFMPNSNFNPKNLPSQFINQHLSQRPNVEGQQLNVEPYETNVPFSDINSTGSAFVPYCRTNTGLEIGNQFSKTIPNSQANFPNSLSTHGTFVSQPHLSGGVPEGDWEKTIQMRKGPHTLPSYVPGKYNQVSELQAPSNIPRNVKDLAFSTYDSNQLPHLRDPDNNEGKHTSEIQETPSQLHGQHNWPNSPSTMASKTYPQNDSRYPPESNYNPNEIIQGAPSKIHGQDNWQNDRNTVLPGHYPQNDQRYPPGTNFTCDELGVSDTMNPENIEEKYINKNIQGTPHKFHGQDNWQNDPNSIFPRSFCQDNPNNSPGFSDPRDLGTNGEGTEINQHMTRKQSSEDDGKNIPTSMLHGSYPQSDPRYTPVSNYTPIKSIGLGPQEQKILTNMQPGNISVAEDFLEPSQVSIGAIHDINYPEIKAAVHGTNDFYEDYSPDSIKEILNNFKLPDCHYCKKPFEEKEFAVTIERANVLFHAHCFKCAGCNQNLADNVYFYSKESNNIYCGRDYAKIRGIPRCKACDELIFTKEYCLAEDNSFHLKHFCCTECDTPLAGQDYIVDDEDGMPYCLPCFERSKADSCNSCGRIIKPDEVGCNLNGVHFHADDQCFACNMCHKPLIGKKLLLRNKTLYCSHDCYGAAQ